MTMLMVPAEMVGPLRGGLHSALGEAAQEIDSASMEASREVDPDFYTGLLARFDRTRALLDVIGWTQTVAAVSVRLDLREYRAALLDALDIALGVLDAEAEEAVAVDAERTQRGEPPWAEQTIRRARLLHEFAAVVRAQANRLGDVDTPAVRDRGLIALGRAVRKVREQHNMSVGDLAGASGLTRRRIKAVEAGRHDPPYDVLLALADGLCVGAVELILRVEAELQDGEA